MATVYSADYAHGMRDSDRKCRILIADDSPEMRRRLVECLSGIPDAEIVGPAEDGTTALRLLVDEAPDVVLLDVQMTGRNALNTVRTMRRCSPSVLLIVCSSYEGEEYEQRFSKAGADYFLSKNRDMDRIQDIVAASTEAWTPE